MITQKFDYKTLKKESVDGKRLYSCPDGNNVASVTTILDRTKDKTQLNLWRKRVGDKKAQEIVTEAASVGTRMHKFLEDYVETDEMPLPGSNPFSQQANEMAKVVKEQALTNVDEIWGSEVSLYHPKIYAGTTDLVGVFKGQECIMDFKQSNKPKKEEWVDDYKMQLVAYALAHNEIYGTKINEGHIFMCCRDLTYQQFDIYPDTFADWEAKWWDRVYQYYDRFA